MSRKESEHARHLLLLGLGLSSVNGAHHSEGSLEGSCHVTIQRAPWRIIPLNRVSEGQLIFPGGTCAQGSRSPQRYWPAAGSSGPLCVGKAPDPAVQSRTSAVIKIYRESGEATVLLAHLLVMIQ